MKILITGCSGMLGYDLCRVLEKEELYCIDLVEPNFTLSNYRFQLCNITDFKETYNTITKINPDIVIHAAAWTDVDGAQSNNGKAYLINALGTRNIAIACQRFDAAMLYISTDYVFDGIKKEPYEEYDDVNPLSVYGKSKYCGELIVRQMLNRFFIVRSSWLFGKNGKNFVKTILNLAKEKNEIKVVDDQIGCPTYTKDLAEAIKLLVTCHSSLSAGIYGTYHITNSGFCSWYEYSKYILKLNGSKIGVKPTTTLELNRPAPRPGYSVLKNFMWELSGFKLLRNWQDALKDYMEEAGL